MQHFRALGLFLSFYLWIVSWRYITMSIELETLVYDIRIAHSAVKTFWEMGDIRSDPMSNIVERLWSSLTKLVNFECMNTNTQDEFRTLVYNRDKDIQFKHQIKMINELLKTERIKHLFAYTRAS